MPKEPKTRGVRKKAIAFKSVTMSIEDIVRKRTVMFFWSQKNQKRGDSDFPAPLKTVSQE